jgi:hypothetical protein
MPYRTPVTAPSHLDEASFRALLDRDGLLRADALAPPDRASAYTCFAQRDDATLDVDTIRRNAEQFFRTKLGLTVEKQYGPGVVPIDAARVVVASDDSGASGTRLCYGRPTDPSDLAAAEAAERAQKTHGMALLAQRCGTVWLVVRESDDDRAALTIAAIFASTMLGPILSPDGREVFGVRTARMKLEGQQRPYR